jgi:hypothetical protein
MVAHARTGEVPTHRLFADTIARRARTQVSDTSPACDGGLSEEAVGDVSLMVGCEREHREVVEPELGEVLQVAGDDLGAAADS